jgi:hypothetical protein
VYRDSTDIEFEADARHVLFGYHTLPENFSVAWELHAIRTRYYEADDSYSRKTRYAAGVMPSYAFTRDFSLGIYGYRESGAGGKFTYASMVSTISISDKVKLLPSVYQTQASSADWIAAKSRSLTAELAGNIRF